MVQFNYTALARQADRVMRRYGRAPHSAYLRREGSTRAVTIFEADYGPDERVGLVEAEDVRYYLSIYTPDGLELFPPPDHELDELVLVNPEDSTETVYLLASAPKQMSPGSINVFWQLHCRAR